MKLIGYVRVSSIGQARDGYGLPAQEHDLRTWCEREGHQLVTIVSEPAKSGGEGLEGRKGLAEALRRLEAGWGDALLVPDLSRLARAIVLQETILDDYPVVSVAEPDLDSDDPDRRFFRQIKGAMNEWYRLKLKLQLAGGREAKRRKGGYVCGRPPYGKRARNRELEDDTEQLATLGVMIALRQDYRKSFDAIAAELNRRAIPGPTGGIWHMNTVCRILTRAGAAKI